MSIYDKWNNLQVVWKWRLLFAGIAFLFLTSYYFNFKRTIAIIKEYKELSTFADTMPDINALLKESTNHIKNSAKLQTVSSETILHTISAFCEENEILVKEITQSSYRDSANYIIETNRITINGSYQNMLRLLYNIEKRQRIATINSVHWELQKDKITSEYILFATLYIKQIKHEHEKS